MEIEVCGDLFADEYPCHRNTWGIAFWAHETGQLKIIKEQCCRAIIRESGHQHFAGRGEFPYTSPRYYIGVFCTKQGSTITEYFTAIYSIKYTRETARAARELANELYETLKEEPK